MLREAAAEQRGVWVGHSNALGQVIRVLFYPRAIEGGRVRGSVDGVEQMLSVHRITGVAPGSPSPSPSGRLWWAIAWLAHHW